MGCKHGIDGFCTRCRQEEKTHTQTELDAAVAAERERCASQVPTNWCDPLLTGPKSVVPATADCRVIERLLQGVRARILGANAEVRGEE